MTPREPPRYIDLTPRPAEPAHEERFARGLLIAVCLGILAWVGIGALVARC